MSRWIREPTDGVLATEDAALYQALHRLEERGLIAADWGVSENNRRAKYVSLTPPDGATCAARCRCGVAMPTRCSK